jgi:hypothetical protein
MQKWEEAETDAVAKIDTTSALGGLSNLECVLHEAGDANVGELERSIRSQEGRRGDW